jgi:DNA-binding CsgD family transcriptional regulator
MADAFQVDDRIAKLLKGAKYPLLVIGMNSLRIVGASEAAEKLFAMTGSLVGTPILDLVVPSERPTAQAAVHLLALRAMVGYHGTRTFLTGDGGERCVRFSIWLPSHDIDVALLALDATDSTDFPWPRTSTGIEIALATTDHDWVIEHVSSDIEGILGQSAEAYKGASVLGLVHPADVKDFMLATGQLGDDAGKATVRIHLRTATGAWQRVHCLVAPMCRHSPPRLGMAFASLAEHDDEGRSDDDYHQVTARGDDALDCLDRYASQSPGAFSTRQWEILTRLVRGERVQDIASALFLSPSTVRNHLTVIYRKFGVRSQTELLSTLLKGRGAGEGASPR